MNFSGKLTPSRTRRSRSSRYNFRIRRCGMRSRWPKAPRGPRAGINIVCGGPVANAREISDRYRAEWAAAGNAPENRTADRHQPFRARRRQRREAMDLGRRAWPKFHASFMKLWKNTARSRAIRGSPKISTPSSSGGAVAGSPATVREQVGEVVEQPARIISSPVFVRRSRT